MAPQLTVGRTSWHTGDAVHVCVLLLSLKQVRGQAASDVSTSLPCSVPPVYPQIVNFARTECFLRAQHRPETLSCGKYGICLFFSDLEWIFFNMTSFVGNHFGPGLPAAASRKKKPNSQALGLENRRTRAFVIMQSSDGFSRLRWVRGRGSVSASLPSPEVLALFIWWHSGHQTLALVGI